MNVTEMLGNLTSLLFILLSLFSLLLLGAFGVSFPGWLVGWIAASNAPQFRRVPRSGTVWATWALLGGLPCAVSLYALTKPWAFVLAASGLAVLNITAFFIGYRQGTTARARREIKKTLSPAATTEVTSALGRDVFDERHPAVASPTFAPTESAPQAGDVPLDLQKSDHRASAPETDDDYPPARPAAS